MHKHMNIHLHNDRAVRIWNATLDYFMTTTGDALLTIARCSHVSAFCSSGVREVGVQVSLA